MTKFSRSKLTLALLLAVLVLTLGYVAYALLIQQTYVVANLDAGSNRQITILADIFYDNGQAFYYDVSGDGRLIVPKHFIGGGDDDGTIRFKLIYSKDRNLVGVIEEHNPNIIYALHDFHSGETWPGSDRFSDSGSQTGLRLRDRLQADIQDTVLMLSNNVPGNVPRKLD
jgi:hypothetical protein